MVSIVRVGDICHYTRPIHIAVYVYSPITIFPLFNTPFPLCGLSAMDVRDTLLETDSCAQADSMDRLTEQQIAGDEAFHKRDIPRAYECYMAALAIATELPLIDPIHEIKLQSRFAQALMILQKNDYAIACLLKALGRVESMHDPTILAHISVCALLGNAYLRVSEHASAITYLKRCMFFIQTTSAQVPLNLTADVVTDLGRAYELGGDYSQACTLYAQSLEMRQSLFDDAHPATADSHMSFGSVYLKMYMPAKACDHANAALRIMHNVPEKSVENEESVAMIYTILGHAHILLTDLENAHCYFAKALAIRKEIYSDGNVLIVSAYNNLGACCIEQGESGDAFENLQAAESLMVSCKLDHHPIAAEVYLNLGKFFYLIDDPEVAIAYHIDAFNALKRRSDNVSPVLAYILFHLGKDHESTDPTRAIDFYERALCMYRETVGDRHILTMKTYESLGELQKTLGNGDASTVNLDAARRIREDLAGVPEDVPTPVAVALAGLSLS